MPATARGWGDLDEDDRIENELAVMNGDRLLSSYKDRDDVRFWIITEPRGLCRFPRADDTFNDDKHGLKSTPTCAALSIACVEREIWTDWLANDG